MELNKKGFTLIELLAVVVILLAISTVAISSISAAIERNKEKQNDAKIKIIESYAEIYYQSHKNSLSSESGCIALNDLDLSNEEEIDAYGEQFDGAVQYFNYGKKFEFKKGISCP